MNIFGFKLNWRALKSEELSRVMNFLATHMTEKELKEEQEKVESELQAVTYQGVRSELEAQNGILAGAIMAKSFNK